MAAEEKSAEDKLNEALIKINSLEKGLEEAGRQMIKSKSENEWITTQYDNMVNGLFIQLFDLAATVRGMHSTNLKTGEKKE